jgi:hypothetical protein
MDGIISPIRTVSDMTPVPLGLSLTLLRVEMKGGKQRDPSKQVDPLSKLTDPTEPIYILTQEIRNELSNPSNKISRNGAAVTQY